MERFLDNKNQFTKTGSGQTKGKHLNTGSFSRRGYRQRRRRQIIKRTRENTTEAEAEAETKRSSRSRRKKEEGKKQEARSKKPEARRQKKQKSRRKKEEGRRKKHRFIYISELSYALFARARESFELCSHFKSLPPVAPRDLPTNVTWRAHRRKAEKAPRRPRPRIGR
eukprot:COSAG06_NODE_13733_length_1224_cov_4.125333_1_plen_167_part_10